MNIYSPEPGTHIPALVKAVMESTGPILELGMGLFSTTLLHALAEDQNRELYSFEHKGKILNTFKRFESEKHHLIFVPHWDDIDIDREWGVALVDHEPSNRRAKEIKRLANNTKYVVAHDSEKENEHIYHYSEIYDLFLYKKFYTKSDPNTVVMSNVCLI